MKKYITIAFLVAIAIGCKKQANTITKSGGGTTAPSSITGLCGYWIMDSITTYRVNFPAIGDTTRFLVSLYSNPSTYHLELKSSVYTYTVSTEIITGYEYLGVAPSISTPHGVWKIQGDTIYFPLTNKPINQGGTVYFRAEVLTSQAMVLTDRAFCAQAGTSMSSFQKKYYHK